MPKTAIVILNWNGINYLKKFLPSVIKYSTNDNTIICIADNGSTDGSAEWINENHKNIQLIRLDKNYGFAGGYNMALTLIDAEYYILLNSDIQVTENWLSPLIRIMDNNHDIASCQPKIKSFSNTESFEYAGAAGGFIDKFGYPFCRGRIFDKLENDTAQYDSMSDIFWSSGACMIVRSEAWKKVGGFDESFFAHMEEIDLCWRFHRSGYRVFFTHESVVYHVGGGALPYNSPFKSYLNFRNNLFLLYKNLPDNKLKTILIARKILDGIAALNFLVRGKILIFKSIWNAHMDFYKNKKNLRLKREEAEKTGIYNFNAPITGKSIIFEFYIKRNKTFNSLNK
jgi:GT2 family glycosyltransferase